VLAYPVLTIFGLTLAVANLLVLRRAERRKASTLAGSQHPRPVILHTEQRRLALAPTGELPVVLHWRGRLSPDSYRAGRMLPTGEEANPGLFQRKTKALSRRCWHDARLMESSGRAPLASE